MRLIKEYDEFAKDLPMIIESKVDFSDKFCDVIKKIDGGYKESDYEWNN